MPDTITTKRESAQERDATAIAHVVALVHARRKGDYMAAAQAHRELERLGVRVKFLKAVANDR